jgi:hypothetical protein
MKKLLITLFMLFTLSCFGQQKKDSITIDRAQFERDERLRTAICNVLQYISLDGKVTDKARFKDAMRIYLDELKPKEELKP